MNVAKFSRQLSLVLLILSLALLILTKTGLIQASKTNPTVTELNPAVEGNITLAFGGDIMLDRGVKNSVYKNFNGDYSKLFFKVQDKLKSYDLVFANLEGPVSARGEDEGGIYSFRMEPKVVPVLKEAGFDVLSVANNHVFNWGGVAFTDTLHLLSVAGIGYVGAGFTGSEVYEAKVFNVRGIRVAVLGFSEFTAGGVQSTSTWPGIATVSDDNIINFVKKASLNSDLVVISFHFGEEYQKLPNDYQIKYARLAVDSGADLVIGHHPHVVQTLETYKDAHIIYSLGNFVFDQYFSPETMQGGLLEVEINPKNKKIEKVSLKKVNINNLFQIESIE